jgi:hypothetical protein
MKFSQVGWAGSAHADFEIIRGQKVAHPTID